jgi:hypothetical protein
VSAPALRDLQAAFWRALGHGADASGPELLAAIAARPPLAPADRLDIYAGMYFHRLLEVLREDFPRVAALVGDERFEELTRAYLARHPSVHPSVRHVGGRFAAFLVGEAVPPWAPDLARLEWARLEVFDAPDAPVLTLDDLRAHAADAWPALRFETVPALVVLETAWPVHRLWPADADATGVAPARTALRVWRDRFLVYQTAMDTGEERALAAFRAGEPFAAVCEAFDAPAVAGATLLRWIEDGIVAAVQ